MTGEAFSIRHRLPGRLRLYLPGLKAGFLMPAALVAALQALPGMQEARASSLTGSLLLFYRPQEIEEGKLLHKVQDLTVAQVRPLPGPVHLAPGGTALLRVFAGGGLLAFLTLKRIILGEPPLARSPRVVNSAALVTAIAGYPLLRRGFTRAGHGGGLNADLLLGGTALLLLLLRESLPGLLILVLAEEMRLAEKLASRQARIALASLARDKECTLRPASLPPVEATRVEHYGEKASKLAVALTGGTYLWHRDIRQALAMLVAGAPVATSLGETAVATTAIRRSVANGILVADGRHFMAMPALDTLVWCGGELLTTGIPAVREIYSLDPAYTRELLLQIAAAACSQASHPLGPVFWRRLQEQGLPPVRVGAAGILPGGAIRADVAGRRLLLGSFPSLRRHKVTSRRGRAREQRYRQTGLLPLYVVIDGQPVGLIALEEPLKEGALAAVTSLRSLGLRKQILIDDAGPEAAGLLARQLGLDGFQVSSTPEEKVAVIKGLKDQGHLVAAVGSKRRDEAALAAADFSLALGQPLATADMFSLNPDPARVLEVFRLAQSSQIIYLQEFFFVQAANIIGMGLGYLRFLSPATAMVWQNMLSLVLFLNAGRLRWPVQAIGKQPSGHQLK
ncbi:HAD family hydrolase [Moorella naiadis]|uniref:HAD family hydrolase n=1 Tax=Moorella naiadis (nom. illeg.) TaxID=3093670 RepID=UPI003D9C9066